MPAALKIGLHRASPIGNRFGSSWACSRRHSTRRVMRLCITSTCFFTCSISLRFTCLLNVTEPFSFAFGGAPFGSSSATSSSSPSGAGPMASGCTMSRTDSRTSRLTRSVSSSRSIWLFRKQSRRVPYGTVPLKSFSICTIFLPTPRLKTMFVPLQAQRKTAQSPRASASVVWSDFRKTWSSSWRPWAPPALNFGENQLAVFFPSVGARSVCEALLSVQSMRRVLRFSTSLTASRRTTASAWMVCVTFSVSVRRAVRLFEQLWWTFWPMVTAATRFSSTISVNFLILSLRSSSAFLRLSLRFSEVFICSARAALTRSVSVAAACLRASSC
mmetsp:Transcript_14754/g.44294  ORF Transcript_14754/g.44294 Transcript_14754/m.44294 type:complete len:330 (+) Transcript_14754:882-1871(+)